MPKLRHVDRDTFPLWGAGPRTAATSPSVPTMTTTEKPEPQAPAAVVGSPPELRRDADTRPPRLEPLPLQSLEPGHLERFPLAMIESERRTRRPGESIAQQRDTIATRASKRTRPERLPQEPNRKPRHLPASVNRITNRDHIAIGADDDHRRDRNATPSDHNATGPNDRTTTRAIEPSASTR